MTPEEIQSIRDHVGSTKRMAELLEVETRTVRYWMERGVKRKKTEREIRELVDPLNKKSRAIKPGQNI